MYTHEDSTIGIWTKNGQALDYCTISYTIVSYTSLSLYYSNYILLLLLPLHITQALDFTREPEPGEDGPIEIVQKAIAE